MAFIAWKVSKYEVFSGRYFPHSDWIRRDTPYLSVFSPSAEKYGPEKTLYLNTFHAVIHLQNRYKSCWHRPQFAENVWKHLLIIVIIFLILLFKSNAVLCEITHFLQETTVWPTYFAIFQTCLSYICNVWGQIINQNHKLSILERQAVRIISFVDFNVHSNQLLYNPETNGLSMPLNQCFSCNLLPIIYHRYTLAIGKYL